MYNSNQFGSVEDESTTTHIYIYIHTYIYNNNKRLFHNYGLPRWATKATLLTNSKS